MSYFPAEHFWYNFTHTHTHTHITKWSASACANIRKKKICIAFGNTENVTRGTTAPCAKPHPRPVLSARIQGFLSCEAPRPDCYLFYFILFYFFRDVCGNGNDGGSTVVLS